MQINILLAAGGRVILIIGGKHRRQCPLCGVHGSFEIIPFAVGIRAFNIGRIELIALAIP